MYIAIFDASFIVPVLLYKLFFVNLVFSVLGSSLLRCAVFHVLSSIDENKDEGKSGATGTSVQAPKQVSYLVTCFFCGTSSSLHQSENSKREFAR